MLIVRDTERLAALCGQFSQEEFVTIDTEFIREKTYFPQLCLVQLAGARDAAIVDPLADGIDLAPLYELLQNPGVVKVFHAARQDVEIFVYRTGTVPAPMFDTQVAAMVCGFGEQAGYETLVQSLAKATIDKSSRFTDWAQRPLTEKQLAYALSDVTHLRTVYLKLRAKLEANERLHWLESEMKILADIATYRPDPRTMWRRFKLRSPKPRQLAVLRELAAWRELAAQQRDIPRNRMLRDEALTEIAANMPRTADDLARTRGLADGLTRGRIGQEILAAVERGRTVPDAECPRLDDRPDSTRASGAVVELLKVLLRMRADEHGVASKLIATSDDLDRIALDDAAEVPALQGWRREIFGADAIALKHGRVALAVGGGRVQAIPRDPKD